MLEESEIEALAVAASVALSGGGSNSLALSGGGAEASNVILTKANAYVKDSTLKSGGDVAITATNTASIESKILAASVAASGGGSNAGAASIGAVRARNLIGYTLGGNASPAESRAYVMNSTIDASDDLVVTSLSNQIIDVMVGAASVAVSGAGSNALGLSGAGVEARNRVRIFVSAFIDGDGNGTSGIVADTVTVSADDSSGISSKAGAASLAIAAAGNDACRVIDRRGPCPQ